MTEIRTRDPFRINNIFKYVRLFLYWATWYSGDLLGLLRVVQPSQPSGCVLAFEPLRRRPIMQGFGCWRPVVMSV